MIAIASANHRIVASRSNNNNNNMGGAKKRAKADMTKLQLASEKLRKAREARQERVQQEIKTTLENIDRLVRDDVKELGDLFADHPEVGDSYFDELDEIVVFKDK